MKVLLYTITFITSLSINAFELKFDCGGKFETLKTMTFSDNSKYFDFKSEGLVLITLEIITLIFASVCLKLNQII